MMLPTYRTTHVHVHVMANSLERGGELTPISVALSNLDGMLVYRRFPPQVPSPSPASEYT